MKNKYYSKKTIQRLDKQATARYGIPALILMENAALHFVGEMKKSIPSLKNKKVLIICGPGNNGGDGLAIARHLHNFGVAVQIICIPDFKHYKNAARINFIICKKMKLKISHVRTNRDLSVHLNKHDIIIDAIFGIGLSRTVTGQFAETISLINKSKKPVWSVDIPSGLDTDHGIPLGETIKAKVTVTFHALKKGFKKPSAKKYTGKQVVVPISLVE